MKAAHVARIAEIEYSKLMRRILDRLDAGDWDKFNWGTWKGWNNI